ncbi:MAG: hypothetical protein HYZ01_04855 [Ignavibacteriales bacterium]|nr:hypothetical protein [Ignavibacteriales bacterium]
MGFRPRRKMDLPITYDGIVFDEGLRLDVLNVFLVPLWPNWFVAFLKAREKERRSSFEFPFFARGANPGSQ